MIEIGIDGTISVDDIEITPYITLIAEDTNFTPKQVIEEPMFSLIGITITIGVAAVC